MSISEICVYRVYECTECGIQVGVHQQATDDFLKECPNCGEKDLVIKSAKSSISGIMDPKKPKTLGSLAEKNTEKKTKEGEDVSGIRKKPFWRKNHKINYDVLKNPAKYVIEGKT